MESVVLMRLTIALNFNTPLKEIALFTAACFRGSLNTMQSKLTTIQASPELKAIKKSLPMGVSGANETDYSFRFQHSFGRKLHHSLLHVSEGAWTPSKASWQQSRLAQNLKESLPMGISGANQTDYSFRFQHFTEGNYTIHCCMFQREPEHHAKQADNNAS